MRPPRRSILTAAVVVAGFAVLTVIERKRPLRRRVEPTLPRLARNATLGAIALAAAEIMHVPLVKPVLRWTERRRMGLLNLLRLPPALHVAASIVLLDYTLWWWHRLNHQWPALWRFHLVHHLDRDLDASTALRFHFGEHALSAVYRAAQIAVIGPTAFALWLWQLLLFASILFHHSNVRIPIAADDRLASFVVTPRMHGIHHSQVAEHTNSNFSALLTCWDKLHGTLRLDVAQESVVIGAPSQEDDVTLGKLLALPFRA